MPQASGNRRVRRKAAEILAGDVVNEPLLYGYNGERTLKGVARFLRRKTAYALGASLSKPKRRRGRVPPTTRPWRPHAR